MTAVERIKEALNLLELVDEESHEHDGDYDFVWSIVQDAVYCQMMINKIVWRCNKVNNPGLEELDPVHVVRCKNCRHWDTADGECYGREYYFRSRAEDFCSYGERKK